MPLPGASEAKPPQFANDPMGSNQQIGAMFKASLNSSNRKSQILP
jgi:hypothetical protein